MPADDQLTRWINDLRVRLASGDLDDLAPFDLGDGSGGLSGIQTVRIMLADLDHLNDQLAVPYPSVSLAIRHRLLIDKFQQLRDLFGVHPVFNKVRMN
jgi:hypothetical protein